MTLRWEQVVVDSHDLATLGRWWADALGWPIINEDAEELELGNPNGSGPNLLFLNVPEGKTVTFEPLPKLAARADAIYRLTVKTLAAGDVRFKTQVTSTNLVEPVIEMEATRIYADAPERAGQ